MATPAFGRFLCAATVGLSLALVVPAVARADSAQCAANKAAMAKIDKAIAELDSSQLPGKLAAELTAVIDQLIEGLTNTKKDLAGITDPVKSVIDAFEGAKKKLGQLDETMKDLKVPRPKALKTLGDKIDKLAGDVAKGIKKYKASAPGQTAKGLEAAGKFIGGVVEKLETAKTALAGVKALDDAKNGTGAEQIRAMKYGFDQLKDNLPIDEVPGLGAFLDVYSQALDGIATSVDSIEKTTKERLKMADVALRDSGFGDIHDLYPGMQSPREKMAKHLAALKERKAALQAALDEGECDKPPPPPLGPCEDPSGNPQKANKLIEAMTRSLRQKYRAAQARYENAFLRVATHGLSQPKAERKSREEWALADHEWTIKKLAHAARTNDRSSYGGRDPLDEAVAVARALGVTLPNAAGGDWRRTANAYLPVLNEAIAKKKQEAKLKAQAAFAANEKAWNEAHAQALADVKAARSGRDEAKAALDKSVGDRIAKEAAAKKWTKAQTDQFDECYPDKGKLRQAAAAAMPPAAAAKPAEKKKCKKGGGLAGAMDNVACQIGGE